MKIGVFVTARLGSSRLEAKHLQLLGGNPALAVLVNRIEKLFKHRIENSSAVLAIVSGCESDNKPLEYVAPNVPIFYGDEHNVPLRHLQAADHYGVQAIVNVDGDDILCSPSAMDVIFDGLLHDGAQYIKTVGLPLGMNCWGYTVEALRQGIASNSLAKLETGWARIFNEKCLCTHEMELLDDKRIRATLDYREDLEFFRRVILEIPMWDALSDKDLIALIIENAIYSENECRINEYWLNFNQGIERESAK